MPRNTHASSHWFTRCVCLWLRASHGFEALGVEAADGEFVVPVAQTQGEAACVVTADGVDGSGPHHRAPVHLPEDQRVELGQQVL